MNIKQSPLKNISERIFQCATCASSLHTITALIELGAGLSLFCFPSTSVALLLTEPLQGASAFVVTRIGGAALVALGVACCFARNDAHSQASKGLIAAMLIYNFATVIVLTFAGIGLQMYGLLLWPGAIMHAVMGIWCLRCLQNRPSI